jgi:hypothetical protein
MRLAAQRGYRVAETDQWLVDYGISQAELRYPLVHRLAIVTSVFGLVGLLWSLPVPVEFRDISPFLNWASAFLMAAVVYYFIIATALAIGMLPFAVGLAAGSWWLEQSARSLELIAALALLLGIGGLIVGRDGRGGAHAVMRDIQLLMIGPVWQLSRLYRRLGIPF